MTSRRFAEASETDQAVIPVIDVSDVASEQGLRRVGRAIFDAATHHGFFYVSGHGIPPAVMAQAFAGARDFFDLPVAAKETIAVNTHQRGWMAQGMSHLSGAKTHDLKEVFFWGARTAADDPDVLAGKPLVAVNQWPADVFPRLEAELLPYYDAVCGTARHLMRALAVSLSQPSDVFDAAYARPLARGQLVYYPPSTAADEAEERFGVAPHTDFGVLTLLLQDDSGGLQVQSRGGWIEAPPIPGTLVCNIGDLLARWSNDRFKSTLHRVINRTARARYSIPIFFDPHPDTVIDPVGLGVAQRDSLYAPVTVGAHIAGRNRQSFAQYKKNP